MDDDLFNELDTLIKDKGYSNRSEIFRDFIREQLRNKQLELESGYCTAVVSYSYNHHERNLSERIIASQHDHSDLVVSTLHVHATPEECVEAVILHGKATDVRKLGEATIAAKGIRNGSVHIIPDEKEPQEESVW